MDPQRELPALDLTALDGRKAGWSQWRGRWILLTVAPADCPGDCAERLYVMRQVRLTTGKDQDRIERVWLLTDDRAPAPALIAQHDGLNVVRLASASGLADSFPPAAGSADEPALTEPGAPRQGHIFVVDPLGHVMMRFPLGVDPNRMKKDIARLLRASRVG